MKKVFNNLLKIIDTFPLFYPRCNKKEGRKLTFPPLFNLFVGNFLFFFLRDGKLRLSVSDRQRLHHFADIAEHKRFNGEKT